MGTSASSGGRRCFDVGASSGRAQGTREGSLGLRCPALGQLVSDPGTPSPASYKEVRDKRQRLQVLLCRTLKASEVSGVLAGAVL